MARNMFSRTVKYGRERPHELAMPDGESSHDSRRKRQGRSSLTEIATFSTFRRCNQPRLASSLFPFFNLFFHYRVFLDFDRRKTRFPFSALILAYSSAFAFFLLARVYFRQIRSISRITLPTNRDFLLRRFLNERIIKEEINVGYHVSSALYRLSRAYVVRIDTSVLEHNIVRSRYLKCCVSARDNPNARQLIRSAHEAIAETVSPLFSERAPRLA
jgi:hypothetical protein